MSLIHNERVKLLANALDRASTACFTVGVATPVAGYLYGLARYQGGAVFLIGALLRLVPFRDRATLVGKARVGRTPPMTPFAYFAFLAPPGILLILGYVAVRLQERAARQDEKQAHADRQGSPHLTA